MMPRRDDLVWGQCYGEGDAEKIAAFERQRGCRLPKSYKEIASRLNGAYCTPNAFRFFSNLNKEEVVLGAGIFMPYGPVEDRFVVTIEWAQTKEHLPEGLVPFSSLGNGDELCFDYRRDPDTDDPPIVNLHHEGEWGTEEQVSPVAQCFDDLLHMLYDDEAEE